MDGVTDDELLLDESLDLIGSTTICGLTYGIALTLYCICVHSLYLQSRSKNECGRRRVPWWLGCISLAMICGTIYLVMDSRTIQMAYVMNRDQSPGGPLQYEVMVLGAQHVGMLATISFIIVAWLTMFIQIWRLWVIWRASRCAALVIILPSLFFFGFFAISIVTVVVAFLPDLLSRQQSFGLGLTFYVLPPALTISTTLLVITRLMMARREHVTILGDTEMATQYLDIIATLIESYAIDAIWSIVSIVFYVVRRPFVFPILFESWIQIKIISLLLVIHRVSKGRAWESHSEREMSTIRWNPAALHGDTEVVFRPPGMLNTQNPSKASEATMMQPSQ